MGVRGNIQITSTASKGEGGEEEKVGGEMEKGGKKQNV